MMMKKRMLILTIVLSAVLGGCSADVRKTDTNEASRELFAMDTVMSLKAWGTDAEAAVEEAAEEILRLDALLSVGNAESEVYAVNHSGGGVLSEDTLTLTERSIALAESTDSAFDITVYPLMELWGFTGDSPSLPEDKDILAILPYCGSEHLALNGGRLTLGEKQGIDFGGIAKGYTGDRIMAIFRRHGIDSGLISLGGNVQCRGTKTDGSRWRCGITDPDYPEDSGHLLGTVTVQDRAVVTSGGYERCFREDGKNYHHIMDIRTGYPAESGLRSVTIVSGDGLLADGLSTACFVMGETKAIAYWREHSDEFDMILLTDDGRLIVTAGLADSFSSDRTVTVEGVR